VSSNGYKLLGFAVWRGAKWYARRKLPSARASAAAGALGVLAVAGAAALVARRGAA
jgi:hypothetical protein